MQKLSTYSTQFDGEHFTGANDRLLDLEHEGEMDIEGSYDKILTIHLTDFASTGYVGIKRLQGRTEPLQKTPKNITLGLCRGSLTVIFVNKATLICSCADDGSITIMRNRKVSANRFRRKLLAHQLLSLLQKGRREGHLSRKSKDWGHFLCLRLNLEYDFLSVGVKLHCAKTCNDYAAEIALLNLNNGDYPQYRLIWRLNEDGLLKNK